MEILKVINKGMLSTVQDLGRFGYKQFGVPQSGAMDSLASRSANILVANDENAPVIEVTYGAFKCVFLCDTALSVTGGDLGGYLNDRPIAMWQTIYVKKGDVLEFKGGKHLRSYIAINNGIACEKIMGSYSTYEKAGFNKPFENDQIVLGDACDLEGVKTMLSSEIPEYDNVIRFIQGPHEGFFKRGFLDDFCSSKYTITQASDRMGVRLNGKRIPTKNKDLLSCPLPVGTIQVPQSGQPIVIMVDGQVTGGYPIIGCVISSDIGKLAQVKPSDSVIFKEVTTFEATAIKKDIEDKISAIRAREFDTNDYKQFNVTVDGESYFVQVSE